MVSLDPPPPESLAPGEIELSCESPIDTLATPPTGYTTALDAVALATASVRPASPSGPGDPYDLFAKTGLVVRADRPVTLTVPPAVAVAWGTNRGKWTMVLRIPGCPGTAGPDSPWMAFPGGFSVRTPQCVPVEVRSGTRRQTLRVPVGRSC
ncbi:hypothetical protein [Cryptosporangium minutisporangium]